MYRKEQGSWYVSKDNRGAKRRERGESQERAHVLCGATVACGVRHRRDDIH